MCHHEQPIRLLFANVEGCNVVMNSQHRVHFIVPCALPIGDRMIEQSFKDFGLTGHASLWHVSVHYLYSVDLDSVMNLEDSVRYGAQEPLPNFNGESCRSVL